MPYVTDSPEAWVSLFEAVHSSSHACELSVDAVRLAIQAGSHGPAKGILMCLQHERSEVQESAARCMRLVFQTVHKAAGPNSIPSLCRQNPIVTSVFVESFLLTLAGGGGGEELENDFALLVSCGIDSHELANGILKALQHESSQVRVSASRCMSVALKTLCKPEGTNSIPSTCDQNPAFASIAVEAFLIILQGECSTTGLEADFSLLMSCGIDSHDLANGILKALQHESSQVRISASRCMSLAFKTFCTPGGANSIPSSCGQNPAFASIAVEAFLIMLQCECSTTEIETDFSLLISCGIDSHDLANGILKALQHESSQVRISASRCVSFAFKTFCKPDGANSIPSTCGQNPAFASIAVEAFLIMLQDECSTTELETDFSLLISCGIDSHDLANGILKALQHGSFQVQRKAANCMNLAFRTFCKPDGANSTMASFGSVAAKALLLMVDASSNECSVEAKAKFESSLRCFVSCGFVHAPIVAQVLGDFQWLEKRRHYRLNYRLEDKLAVELLYAALSGDEQILSKVLKGIENLPKHVQIEHLPLGKAIKLLPEELGRLPSVWHCVVRTFLEFGHLSVAADILYGLAKLPYLGMTSFFASPDFDQPRPKSRAGVTLPLYLEMRERYVYCRFLRMLHGRLRIPSGAWMNIVDFVGLYNVESRSQTIAHGCTSHNQAEEVNTTFTEEQFVVTEVDGQIQLGVIDDIDHHEPAAEISPEEAAITANELCTSLIQHSLQLIPSLATCDDTGLEQHVPITKMDMTDDHDDVSDIGVCAEKCDGTYSVEESESPKLGKKESELEEGQSLDAGYQKTEMEDNTSVVAATVSSQISNCAGQSSKCHDATIRRYPRLFLLNFTRHPKIFEEALCQGEELREIRESMESAGHVCKLACGTKVFVAPSEYKLSRQALNGRKLGPSYVVVSEALEELVVVAVNRLPHKVNVREKNREVVAQGDFAVERTFLSCVHPSSDDHVTASSTQARRGSRNPRQVAVDIDLGE